ncbi:glutamate 5-kinase [Chitinophaga skermanii]|uniref:Glutamate 5-kinase n=1 Tax=Chitinophaga skermanii TaxID=331697 RepID=A0A327QS53_9BACT|nr:glutamate 5-kinase [Chitinophaga skermanii]RAJ06474.1 glutamate 5-kinase [Chitinophaga skermanii]
MASQYRKIVVKIGSNVLTQKDGLPDLARIQNITAQIAQLRSNGIEVILVSSGAVASGRSIITVPDKTDTIAARQLLAAVGQVKLLHTYYTMFAEHGVVCAQVLVTKEDFRDRKHYLNMKNCFTALLQNKVVPIVNENDVVSVTELMFTDNDELAGLVAAMLNADALIILSNVDGVFNGDPKQAGATVIKEIHAKETNFASFIAPGKSQFGRGGMVTKSAMAQKVARLGIPVHVANGTKDDILLGLLSNDVEHTKFVPGKTASGTKKWLATTAEATGIVQVNEGAKTALTSGKAISLLPVGIVAIKADFSKGDIIKVVDEAGVLIGFGIAQYGADKARERIGERNQKALVHYDYFYPSI